MIDFSAVAIIAATLLGPVAAVQVQKYLERWRDESERRKKVFKTLMATRAARLSVAHVEALNLIDLEFPATRKQFKRVRSAWKAYLTHLGETPPQEPQVSAVFYAKREDMFQDMLYEMGLALGYDFDKTQIGKDAYSTQYHEKMDADNLFIRTKLVEILSGKAGLPMTVLDFPSDPAFIEAQAEYLKLMAEHVREGKPWPVAIVGNEAGKVVPMRPAEQKNAVLPDKTGAS
jgi:hypothetical protein